MRQNPTATKVMYVAMGLALALVCFVGPRPLKANTRLDSIRIELNFAQTGCWEPNTCDMKIDFLVDLDREALAGQLGVSTTSEVSVALDCYGAHSLNPEQAGPGPIESDVNQWPWQDSIDMGSRLLGPASGTCWLSLYVDGEPYFKMNRQFWFDVGRGEDAQISHADYREATRPVGARRDLPVEFLRDLADE